MPGPETPATASLPIPPPVTTVAFTDPRGFLTPTGINFLQLMWAAIQGGGGIIDLISVSLSTTSITGSAVAFDQAAIQTAVGIASAQIARAQALLSALSLAAVPPGPRPAEDAAAFLLAPSGPHQGLLGRSAQKWTPVLAGSTTAGAQTYSKQVGTFFESGPLCIASFNILLTAFDVTTAGNMRITGLPFPVGSVADAPYGVAWARWGGITLQGGAVVLVAGASEANGYIDLTQTASTLADAALTAAAMSNTSELVGTLVYLK
jgi:hypothetical protein